MNDRDFAGQLPFDSVVCFGGEDWWYHNRGHFDMQMMRELSKRVPVVYFNSLGMRTPRVSEGNMFIRRIRRKWKSIRRGIVRINDRYYVCSLLYVPGKRGRRFWKAFVGYQVCRTLRRLGFRRPLVWVALPTVGEMLDGIPRCGLVYQRTDRFEDFSDVRRDRITALDRQLKREADLTIFCSTVLLSAEQGQCRRAEFVDHGVDFERFAAGNGAPEPDDVKPIPRPRVGFVGAIDPHTFDPQLFRDVVRRLPELQFVLVGDCTLPTGWINSGNVHMLGQKPYDEVWRYPAAFDVLIMPWNRSPWIAAANPVKLKEYMAAGRPIVTTYFDELRRYEGFVTVATNAEAFADSIQAAVSAPRKDEEVSRLQERVRHETWVHKGEQMLALLQRVL
jgi:glycosyltransferase involved in cell wall biosynthesis